MLVYSLFIPASRYEGLITGVVGMIAVERKKNPLITRGLNHLVQSSGVYQMRVAEPGLQGKTPSGINLSPAFQALKSC